MTRPYQNILNPSSGGELSTRWRSGIRVPVILKYANHTIEANTLDVSASGLRLKRPEGVYIRPGEVTDVDFRDKADMNVAATVAYTGESRIGLEFCGRRFSEYELRELYEIAPSWQRLTARSKRALWTHSRRFAVLMANTYLRGLLVASQFMEDELEADSEKVRLYLDQLHRDYPDAQRIALVGRLPNFVMKAGIEITAATAG